MVQNLIERCMQQYIPQVRMHVGWLAWVAWPMLLRMRSQRAMALEHGQQLQQPQMLESTRWMGQRLCCLYLITEGLLGFLMVLMRCQQQPPLSAAQPLSATTPLPQAQVVSLLHQQAKIEPSFTTLVWQKLEEQNPNFFKLYYVRLKLKEQIVMFNYLLEQQVR